jgi:uncharacterized protein YecA (UPF0149 family)
MEECRRQDEERRRAAMMRGRPMPPRTVGRNDPCPCGSGKKFKNCCERKRR